LGDLGGLIEFAETNSDSATPYFQSRVGAGIAERFISQSGCLSHCSRDIPAMPFARSDLLHTSNEFEV
jgi:hypothetical protein